MDTRVFGVRVLDVKLHAHRDVTALASESAASHSSLRWPDIRGLSKILANMAITLLYFGKGGNNHL